MRLLVPVDDTPTSLDALEPLANLFDTEGTTLHLLSVIDPSDVSGAPVTEHGEGEGARWDSSPNLVVSQHGPAIVAGEGPNPEPLTSKSQAINRIEARRGSFLRAEAARYFGRARIDVRTVLAGDVVGTILGYSEELAPDMLAMGTRARGTVGKLFLGSVAEDVLRQSAVPVMLIAPGVQAR